MNLLIRPSSIQGIVAVPPSKSLTHRYFILAALADGKSIIDNPLICDDTLYTLQALKKMGVKILQGKNRVTIYGNSGKFNPLETHLYLGDSGTSSRFFIGLSALSLKPIDIDGSPRLRERPNEDLLKALEKQGIKIKYAGKQYYLPLTIFGNKLQGGKLALSGKTSSQFISSLLMISPFTHQDMQIVITDELKSAPYVDLTLDVMNDFGVQAERSGYSSFSIASKQKYKSGRFQIEGDYSSAAYFLTLSFLAQVSIIIKNLKADSKQADKAILDLLMSLGGVINKVNGGLSVKREKVINNGQIDVSGFPDLALTLGIIGPFTKQFLTLKGIERLKTKECDRKAALINNLLRVGAKLEIDNDQIKIYRSDLKSNTIETYGDHRVAMSFSILGLLLKEGIVIKNAQVVNKSYPHFFDDLKKIGANIRQV